jgi:hypothetical protein
MSRCSMPATVLAAAGELPPVSGDEVVLNETSGEGVRL